MRFKRAGLLGVGLIFGAACAFAQVGATLHGTVMDPSGGAVPNAKVQTTNAATALTLTTQTNGAGFYSFERLPVGTYELTVDAKGFKAARATGIALAVGAVANYDIRLEVGVAQQTVTVTARANLVESTRSQSSTVVNPRAVADLPVDGRNFIDFTLLTPGVTRDPTRFGDLSFAGQRGTANSLLVDGADSNQTFFGQAGGRAGSGRNPYSFSQDAVQEFQVNTNSYGAEIGRAGGGVINVITKSGTNDFHGSGFEFFRDKSLNANSFERNQRGLPKGAFHFNQFGMGVGGPIIKNKAFFFFDYDGQRNINPVTVFLQVAPPSDPLSQQAFQSLKGLIVPFSTGLRNDVYLGKSDIIITSGQRLSVRYNANRFKGMNFENAGTSSVQEHTGDSDVFTDSISLDHNWVLNPRAVLESHFAFTRDDEPGLANSTAPEGVIRQNGIVDLQIGRNSFSPRSTGQKVYQWIESLSYVRGRHTFKVGQDITFQRIANFFPGNFSGSFTFNSFADFASGKPFSFTQAFAGPNTNGPLTEPDSTESAVYAEDSWRASDRLTLNYGLRYDLFDFRQTGVKNPDPGLAALGLDTSRINKDTNNVAPRFGFAYKLDQDGKTAIRGGYGIFYGRTASILPSTAIAQNGIQVQTFTLFSNFPTYPNILSAPPALMRRPDIFVFAPDYVQPLTQQWSFNFERLFGKDFLLTVGYLGVRGEHLTRTRDINLLPAVPVQGSFANGTPVTFLRHPGRIDPNFGRISLFDSGADSIYHGGFIQLTKRFSQNFQVLTSYTYSKVIDDDPDQTSVVVGPDDSKDAQDTLNPGLERGRGNADIRHRFVLSGVWDINYARSLQNRPLRWLLSGYQFSTVTTVQSGRPFNATVNRDVNNDGNTRTDRPPGVGRNTVAGPKFADVDIRFSRDVPLYRERVKVRLIFEAFNLFNRANFATILTNQFTFNTATRVFSPDPSFLRPTTTFDPRILQLAGKIIF